MSDRLLPSNGKTIAYLDKMFSGDTIALEVRASEWQAVKAEMSRLALEAAQHCKRRGELVRENYRLRATLTGILEHNHPAEEQDGTRVIWRAGCTACDPRTTAAAALSGDSSAPETSDSERRLRLMLAFAYSGPGELYGDDGELQNSAMLPMIDFNRDSVPELERKIRERGMRKLAAAGSVEETSESRLISTAPHGEPGLTGSPPYSEKAPEQPERRWRGIVAHDPKECGPCDVELRGIEERAAQKTSPRPLTRPERDALNRAADASVTVVDTICSCGKRLGEHPNAPPWWPCMLQSAAYTNEAPAYPPILPERFNSVSVPETLGEELARTSVEHFEAQKAAEK